MTEILKAPFPYFGGKSPVAALVWERFGTGIKHYLEPFFGSGAVLFARPDWDATTHIETVCDADGYVCNAWRAMQFDPDEVAKVCDWPVNHVDLMARKKAIIAKKEYLLSNLCNDEKWFDAEIAGYWIWAASCWIGSGMTRPGSIPHLTDGGKGVQEPYNTNLYTWFRALSERLRYVRVVCGDWSRICGGNWQDAKGPAGIFFDPPYSLEAGRNMGLYECESGTVAHDVRKWALKRGDNPRYKIAVCGYEGEHDFPDTWEKVEWKAGGGYSKLGGGKDTNQNQNRHRERIWFSPSCAIAKAEDNQLSLLCRKGDE